MNIQPAYLYLNRPYKLDIKVRRLLYKREALLSCLLPKALVPKEVQVQESVSGDKLGDILGEVEEIEQNIDALLREKAEAVRDTAETIDKLESEEERAVLIGFFLARKSMMEIAEEIHYSRRSIFRLKHRALEHLMELI